MTVHLTTPIVAENVAAVPSKPKRRPYLLKRKALTTSIFDTNRKDSDKGNVRFAFIFSCRIISRCGASNDDLTSKIIYLSGMCDFLQAVVAAAAAPLARVYLLNSVL